MDSEKNPIDLMEKLREKSAYLVENIEDDELMASLGRMITGILADQVKKHGKVSTLVDSIKTDLD